MVRRIAFLFALLCALIVAGLVISLLQFASIYAYHPFEAFLAGWGSLLFSPLAILLVTLASPAVGLIHRSARRLSGISTFLGVAWGPAAYWAAGNPSLRFQSGTWFHAIVIWGFAILILSLVAMVLHVVGRRVRRRVQKQEARER